VNVAWSSKLGRPISLRSGETLTTFQDAGDYLQREFGRVTKSEALAWTISRLIAGAEGRTVAGREEASQAVESFLSAQRRLPDVQDRIAGAIQKAKQLRR